MVKWRTEYARFESRCAGIFPGRVIPVTSILALQWPLCQASSVKWSVLGLIGLVSVYRFLGSSHTSDLKIGTPVAILLGAWRYRVSAGTVRPGVSILRLGEMESLICNFNLSVATRKPV